ncbi:phosphoenolpyruvate--protein phosphotransferase [Paenibacillus chartarius]|uniref:Phosphoenolpyruvate-protein phosphotransferase n=1 Tax=Paenibacillus chartarius TaxID=747481 RepID=A0ABV6DPK3_9BACL
MMMKERTVKGIAASTGIQFGTAYHYGLHEEERVVDKDAVVAEEQIEAELERLADAKAQVHQRLQDILDRNASRFDEKQQGIIAGHQGILKDPAFTGDMEKTIRKQHLRAEAAALRVTEKFVKLFESMDKEYMRERAQDIRDIGGRLLDALQGKERQDLSAMPEGTILIAHDITPSDAMEINPQNVVAFVTRIGGKTSHTAILARSMGIPAIVGMGEAIDGIPNGASIIVDGETGICVIDPAESTAETYRAKRVQTLEEKSKLEKFRHLPAATADGVRFELVANIGSVHDSELAAEGGAEGVGLFRTEFMYMNASRMPSEEQQFEVYRDIAAKWGERPVIIRTLDIGGDKALPYLALPEEENPFLGYRAIRIGLNQPDVLKTQLRAILRASAYGTLKIMFPMISSMEEWRQAKSYVQEAALELEAEGVKVDRSLQVGIMAEIPSVIQMADLFAKEVDFFSIGTNDLVQYTLAVDRMNEKVAYLYDYFHPAVLRAIHTLIQAAHAEGKWVGMCGGMAGDPLAAPLLVGLGLDEWSMETAALNRVKSVIAKLNREECEQLARQLLNEATAQDIRSKVELFVSGK